jgi:hypothetical protein
MHAISEDMIKMSKVKPGMELLSVRRARTRKVQILSIDPDGEGAEVLVDGTSTQRWHKVRIERLFVTPPKAYRK